MKLLICTQKVDMDDDVLGFFHDWIAEFAKTCEQVTVICLKQGTFDLPANVKVLSLGKEKLELGTWNLDIIKKLKYGFNFLRYIRQERQNYDTVFVHMNQIYAILGGFYWRLQGKKIGLWYTHKQVNLSLRLAEKIVDHVFTASEKSFRIESPKKIILGHGIDIEKYRAIAEERDAMSADREESKQDTSTFRIITVGRISPIKDYETLIGAAKILSDENRHIEVEIIGGPGTPEQAVYLEELKGTVEEKKLADIVRFAGAVPNREIAGRLKGADLFVNMSRTGSVDKAVLEAMACGLPVVTGNEAFTDIFKEHIERLMYIPQDCADLATKIKAFQTMDRAEKNRITAYLHRLVERDNNLSGLITKIMAAYAAADETAKNRSANIDKYQASHERLKFAIQPGKIVKTELFRRRLGVLARPGEKILDIGGGGGIWTDIIREEKLTQDISALDISEQVLKERNAADKTFIGDMEQLPFGDACFDRVMFFASLHHTRNTAGALREAWRVVRPGGHIFLWEPISITMRISGKRIEAVNQGVEYRMSLPHLMSCVDALSGRSMHIYYEGFLKRCMPGGNISWLRAADKLEENLNKIPLIKHLAGHLAQSVMITIRK